MASKEDLHRSRRVESIDTGHIRGPREVAPKAVDQLLTVKQAAERCQVSQRQIRRLIKNGDLPVRRFGRSVRIHPRDLGL